MVPEVLLNKDEGGGGTPLPPPEDVKVNEGGESGGKRYAKWLIKDPRELDKLPEGLSRIVRRVALRPDSLIGVDYLAGVYGSIEAWIDEDPKKRRTREEYGDLYLARIADKMQALTESDRVGDVLRPKENTEREWVCLVLTELKRLEGESERLLIRSADFKGDPWGRLARSIELMPEGERRPLQASDRKIVEDPLYGLAAMLARERPEGFCLKDKLRIYIETRRRFNDRFVEIKKAKGRLIDMGVGGEDVPFEGIKIQLQEIRPIDFLLFINGDRLVIDELGEVGEELREILPDVTKGLDWWWRVAMLYDQEVERGSGLSFQNALNSVEIWAKLQDFIGKQAGSSESARLAERFYTVTLTFPLLDKERKGGQGSSEDRDVIHIERKRVNEFLALGRETGVHWTIGRYFCDSTEDKGRDKNDRYKYKFIPPEIRKLSEEEIIKGRIELIVINLERAVFDLADRSYPRGEFVGDFLNTPISVPDRIRGGNNYIFMRIMDFVVDRNGNPIDGGWRRIPWWRLGPNAYSGYFSYHVGAVGLNISKEIRAEGLKPEEITDPQFWGRQQNLFDRLNMVSPWFNNAEYEFRGFLLRGLLRRLGSRSPEYAAKVERVNGIASLDELLVIGFTEEEVQRIGEELDKPVENIPKEEREDLGVDKATTKREYFWKKAKREAERYTTENIMKMRMLNAMGKIWWGTLANRAVSKGGLGQESFYEVEEIRDALRAIKESGYLGDDYLKQLIYEIMIEMGVGSKGAEEGKKRAGFVPERYRIGKEGNFRRERRFLWLSRRTDEGKVEGYD